MADRATPLQAETETDRLRIALTQAEADLQRHCAALSKLQGELMASRLEVSGARGETVQFQGMLHRAEAEAAAAQARILELMDKTVRDAAEIARLQVEAGRLQAEASHLQAERDALRASVSWRISAPVRLLGRLLRRLRRPGDGGVAGRIISLPPTPAPTIPPAPPPADPNEPYIFKPAPPSGNAPAVVTLDELYQLSRSL